MLAARLRVWCRPRHLCYRSVSSLPPLPTKEQWKAFPLHGQSHRVTVRNPETADRLVSSFFSDEHSPPTAEGKVVVEAFAGVSLL